MLKSLLFLVNCLLMMTSIRSQTPLPVDQNAVLTLTNQYRTAHGSPPVTWDPTVATFSQNWANYMASTGNFAHSSSDLYGENLAQFFGSNSNFERSAINLWYAESSKYNYNNPESNNFNEIGHFSQLVWKSSTSVGMGIARSSSGLTFVAMNFHPPGNYFGLFTSNVLPTGSSFNPPVVNPSPFPSISPPPPPPPSPIPDPSPPPPPSSIWFPVDPNPSPPPPPSSIWFPVDPNPTPSPIPDPSPPPPPSSIWFPVDPTPSPPTCPPCNCQSPSPIQTSPTFPQSPPLSPPPIQEIPSFSPPPPIEYSPPPPPQDYPPLDYSPPITTSSVPRVNLGSCSSQSSALTSLSLTYVYDGKRVYFNVIGWYADSLPITVRQSEAFAMTPSIPKYIYFAHPPMNPVPFSKVLANYYTSSELGQTSNTCDDFNFVYSGRGWNVDRVKLLSTTHLFNTQIIVNQDYVRTYMLDQNAMLTYAFMTPNTICSLSNPYKTACWCPVLQVQFPLSFLYDGPVDPVVPVPSPVIPVFPVDPVPSPVFPVDPVPSPVIPVFPVVPVPSPVIPVFPVPSPVIPVVPVPSPVIPVDPVPSPVIPVFPVDPVPSPVIPGVVPQVDLGKCPDQSDSLTSLFITYAAVGNRMVFTINGWFNDALPFNVRTNPRYSQTPTIPKYIYFAHPPTNPSPASKTQANYYTGTTSNTCDNFNFDFGGKGWNVDRVNLLSTTTLFNVQVFVNLDYVYNYLLDSNGMLTYAFMTPNAVCGSTNTNHCWCPVLQVKIR